MKGREWGWWGAATGQRRDVVKGLEMGGGVPCLIQVCLESALEILQEDRESESGKEM